MRHILDQFVPTLSGFRPKTITDLLGLRIAAKFNDVAAARHYAELASQYSEPELLTAFRHTMHSGMHYDLGRRFHVELRHSASQCVNGGTFHLAAIRVERRAVAVAVFTGDHLSYTQVRQLSSDKDKAVSSAVGFVTSIAEQFHLDSAAMESIPAGNEVHRQVLNQAVIGALREQSLPIWNVAKQDLFQAYGHPPLKSRKELREIAIEIWPVLEGSNGKSFIQDAAVLGLHVQIEHLLILN